MFKWFSLSEWAEGFKGSKWAEWSERVKANKWFKWFKLWYIAVPAMLIGYAAAAAMIMKGLKTDHSMRFILFLIIGVTGTFMFIAERRKLPLIPHILFLVLSAGFTLVQEECYLMSLIPLALGAVSVCIFGKSWDYKVFIAAYVLIGVSGLFLAKELKEIRLYMIGMIAGIIPLANYILTAFRRNPKITDQQMTAWMQSLESKYEDSDLLEALLKRIADESEKSYQKIRVIELFTDRMIITALTRGQDTFQTAVFSDLECSVEELPDIMNVRAFANVMQRRLGQKYCVARQQNPNSARIVIAV